MTSKPLAAVTSRPAQPVDGHEARLRGLSLRLAQVGWVAIAILSTALFAASVPIYYDGLRTLSVEHIAHDLELMRIGLNQIGISQETFALAWISLAVLSAAVFIGVGALIFLRRPNDPAALLASLVLVMFGAIWPNTLTDLGQAYPALELPASLLGALGFSGFLLLFYIFPDGRFVPRWTWPLGILIVVEVTIHDLFPTSPLNTDTWPVPLNLISFIFPITIIYAQIYRYRKVSTPLQRQQTKWVVFSFVAAIACLLAFNVIGALPALRESEGASALFVLGSSFLFALLFLLVPIAIGFAVLRYRLWDIDPIVNRTLVYGVLTVNVVAVYVIVVGWLGIVFQTENNVLFSLIATGLVAVLFQPLRERLQRLVNRLMYGERDDPYAVISRLGQRLEDAFAPDAVLPAIVDTITDALKLPYAAITLRQGESLTVAAATGSPVPDPVRMPLVYQHEPVGELLVAPRSAGESFSPGDQKLLLDLARQAGVAAHAVRLTAELQQARERLVEAREEERRRLRRDLHDGLGSQLAALNMELGVLGTKVDEDPDAAAAHVREIRAEIRNAIATIRQIAHDLRPPVLDDLGLRAALQARAQRYASDGLHLTLELPESFPPLSAAVEVAIYRIVEEALTNVVRHARARHCVVELALGDEMTLSITDDGVGLGRDPRAGVGLLSMRERAEELGGSLTMQTAEGGGTRILVTLPLSKG
jgi:signal transduction histidine kinase